MTKDLTKGSPTKLILSFAIPLILGNLFQQAYNLVDTVIVGRLLGTDALAAVGATGSVNFLIVGCCLGISSGFAIPVAQKFGAKDFKALRKFVGNIVILSIILTSIVTVLTVIFCRDILEIMGTPSDIIDASYNYLVVIFAGIPVLFFYNTVAGIIRSLGDSKTPVIFLVISSIVNIALDLLFIMKFDMGVTGAALATVISQAVASIGCYIVIKTKFDILKLDKSDYKPDKHYIKRLLAMGLPMGFQFSITAIGSVMLQAAINSLGSIYVAAMTTASRLGNMFVSSFDAFASTSATYSGQNLGAGYIKRIKKGLRSTIFMGIGFAIAFFIVLFIFGKNMITLFVSANETEVIELAYQFLVINASFYIPLAFVNIVRLTIQGLGYSNLAMIAGVLEMIARGAIAVIWVPLFGFIAVCFASPAAWTLADLFLIPCVIFLLKSLTKKIPERESEVKLS